MVEQNLHASCVCLDGGLFGARGGVLLLGASGAGKSSLALRLIGRGAVLVADDRTLVIAEAGGLFAAPHARLEGLIEVRGVGIVPLPFLPRARLILAADLSAGGARLPDAERWTAEGLGISLPLIRLLGCDPAAPEKIAIAAALLGTDRV